jgi:hypothetical protein
VGDPRLGPDAHGERGPAVDGGEWARLALYSPEVVIGGETSNTRKTIIAERILGLPKDDRSTCAKRSRSD